MSTPAPTVPGGAPSPAPKPAASGATTVSTPTSTSRTPPGSASPADARNPTGASKQLEQKRASPDAPETKVEEPFRRKFKLKIDGKEVEEEYDETRLTTELQKGRAADKRFQEAAERTKLIERALAEGKKDPARAMKELFGVDVDEWSQKRIAERFQEELLSPEERKQREVQRELDAYKQRDHREQTAQQTAQQQAFEKQVWEESEQEAMSALDELGYEDKGFQRNFLLPLLADVAVVNLQKGIDLTPKQLAAQVQKRLDTIHNRRLTGVKGEKLLSMLGDDVVREVLVARRDKLRGAPIGKERSRPRTNDDSADQTKTPTKAGKFWRNVLAG